MHVHQPDCKAHQDNKGNGLVAILFFVLFEKNPETVAMSNQIKSYSVKYIYRNINNSIPYNSCFKMNRIVKRGAKGVIQT